MEPSIDPERPPEHAFGTIHAITIPLRWGPTPTNPRRKVRNLAQGMTETWSVSGVGFTSPTNAEVAVASMLTVVVGPITGEVVVRTVHPTETDGISYYGVEFIGDDLQSVARDLISIHLKRHPEARSAGVSPLGMADPNQPNLSDWS
ncbi:MAG: hypothetical protein JST73_01535 [Actinobacteria bacterium]|nr:hypothetical protein [Actinomycetota bacterium]